MDDADRSDERIQNVISDGITRARLETTRHSLLPLVVVGDDGKNVGICHYCESSIRPGHLFCPAGDEEPQYTCAQQWEHEFHRKRDCGIR